MRRRVLAVLMASLVPLLPARARSQDDSEPLAKREASPGPKPEDAQRRLQKIRTKRREMREREMAALKEKDPQAYAERLEARKRQKMIDQIVAAARSRTLTEEQAENELSPLLKTLLQPQLNGLPERIARLEKRLILLKQFQKDPELLVRRRAQELLGERAPEPLE